MLNQGISESLGVRLQSFINEALACTLFLLFFSSLFALGCGPNQQLKQSQRASCHLSRSHPSQQYLTESAQGITIQKARESASAELTRRLSAELTSKLIVGSSMNSENRSQEQVQDQVEESVELSTHFKHAELIKTVKACEFCSDSLCSSSVALNRDQFAQRLVNEISPEIKRLTSSAQDLNKDSPLLRFTQAWYIAQASFERITPILNQLKVIQRTTTELTQIEKLMENAHRQRAQREERLWVGIRPLKLSYADEQEGTKLIKESVLGRFNKALERMGLKRWAQADCPTQKKQADVLMITPVAQLNCSLGFIGPQCKLDLGLDLSLCHQGQLSEELWSELKLVGVHPRETKGALQKLVKKLGQTDLSAVLSKTLSPFIIL